MRCSPTKNRGCRHGSQGKGGRLRKTELAVSGEAEAGSAGGQPAKEWPDVDDGSYRQGGFTTSHHLYQLCVLGDTVVSSLNPSGFCSIGVS
jgi:hypothetical protein